MNTFTAVTPIPSTRVNRELVLSIEQYLAQQLAAISGGQESSEKIREVLSVVITDEFGVETLHSIDAYVPTRFSDSTSRLTIEYRGPWKSSLMGMRLSVRFDRERHFSMIDISFEGANARAVVQGLIDGLLRCIHPHAAGTGWLHPTSFNKGAVSGISTVLLWAAAVLYSVAPKSIFLLVLAASLTGFAYSELPQRFRPYVLFDSNQTERYDRNWDWFTRGIAGFLLFGILFALGKDWLISLVRNGG